MIPRSLENDCLPNKINRKRFDTCSCDAHCSWDVCRTSIPSSECLLGTYSIWKPDHVKNSWMAQRINGNNIDFSLVRFRLFFYMIIIKNIKIISFALNYIWIQKVFGARANSYCHPRSTMRSTNRNDANTECQNNPHCDMFYDFCGNGDIFKFCNAASASMVHSTCGAILYTHGNAKKCICLKINPHYVSEVLDLDCINISWCVFRK